MIVMGHTHVGDLRRLACRLGKDPQQAHYFSRLFAVETAPTMARTFFYCIQRPENTTIGSLLFVVVVVVSSFTTAIFFVLIGSGHEVSIPIDVCVLPTTGKMGSTMSILSAIGWSFGRIWRGVQCCSSRGESPPLFQLRDVDTTCSHRYCSYQTLLLVDAMEYSTEHGSLMAL